MPEIMEPEVLDSCEIRSCSRRAAVRPSPHASAGTVVLLLADRGGVFPKLCGQLRRHRHIPNLSALELRACGDEAFGKPKIAPG